MELWLVDLDQSGPALLDAERRTARLSADDHVRLDATADTGVRETRFLAHVALRLTIARISHGSAWDGAAFIRSPAGRPSLPGSEIDFNLSHAGRYVLIAASRIAERAASLGVDIETPRSVCMSADRQQRLVEAASHLSDDPARCRDIDDWVLLQAWVRIEALAKALDLGALRVLTALGVLGGAQRGAVGATSGGGLGAFLREAGLFDRIAPYGETGVRVHDLNVTDSNGCALPAALATAGVLSINTVPTVGHFPTTPEAINRFLDGGL